MRFWLIHSEYSSHLSKIQLGLPELMGSRTAFLTESTVEPGDGCVLWRSGPMGGVVAIGEVEQLTTKQLVRRPALKPRQDAGVPAQPSRVWACAKFEKFLLSAPLSPRTLLDNNLYPLIPDRRSKPLATGPWRHAELEDVAEDSLRRLDEVSCDVQPPTEWPGMWNIEPGEVVKRSKLSQVYGAPPSRWAGFSRTTPNAFLFLARDRGYDEYAFDKAVDARCRRGIPNFLGGHAGEDRVRPEQLTVIGHLIRGVPLRVFATGGLANDCLYLGEFTVDQADFMPHDFKGEECTSAVCGIALRQLCGMQLPIESRDLFSDLGSGAPRNNPVLLVSDDSSPTTVAVRRLLYTLKDKPAAAVLGDIEEAQALAALMQHARRQADLDKLRAAVEDPGTKEETLRKLLTEMTWLFGGEFACIGRRDLTVLDELDLALLRSDGSLQGVECKKATLAKGTPLVKQNHGYVTVGSAVHDAYCQANNYLRALDESRDKILADWKIDCRRATMTVVIGRSESPGSNATSQEVDEAIRTYNSDHARVTVITYDRLLQNAQRTLDITAPTVE